MGGKVELFSVYLQYTGVKEYKLTILEVLTVWADGMAYSET